MNKKISRRDFVISSAAAGIAASTPVTATAQAPATKIRPGVRPVVIASRNGITMKNGGDISCVETEFDRKAKGADVLDALIAGVSLEALE